MDELTNLHLIVSNISETSKAIIGKSAVILNQILSDSERVYDQIRNGKSFEEVSDEDIEMAISEVMNEYISDSKNVKNELKPFVNSFLKKNVQMDEKSFLYEVWSGDIYGETEMDGLQKLVEDLSEKESKFTLKHVIELTKLKV